MNIEEEPLLPHILSIIGKVVEQGDFFFSYKCNKGSTKKKKIISGYMEMKTLSLLISFFLKESKGFNFQAFKVILNSINISNKTSIFKLAILWSVMEEKET